MPEDARRQDQDEASSWTHVQPRSRRRKPHQPEPLGQPENPPKPREDGLRSVDEISAEYRRTRQQFEESKSCSSLRELVRLNCSAVGAVSRAVCLGIGTFDPADGGWTAKRKAFVQLIAFLIMVEEIGMAPDAAASLSIATLLTAPAEKRWNIQISCIFQEPILTTSDTGFIASLGHTVVETPRGCELVDEHTLLFGVHLYHPIYALALKNGLPGIFVGTGWDMWDQ